MVPTGRSRPVLSVPLPFQSTPPPSRNTPCPSSLLPKNRSVSAGDAEAAVRTYLGLDDPGVPTLSTANTYQSYLVQQQARWVGWCWGVGRGDGVNGSVQVLAPATHQA